jgi:hypothetical protein
MASRLSQRQATDVGLLSGVSLFKHRKREAQVGGDVRLTGGICPDRQTLWKKQIAQREFARIYGAIISCSNQDSGQRWLECFPWHCDSHSSIVRRPGLAGILIAMQVLPGSKDHRQRR